MASSPFVYWAQDEKSVFLRVDLRDAVGIKHELDDCGRKLQFWATGTGARGRDEYYFELNLHAQLKTTGKGDVTVRAGEHQVSLTLAKADAGWWQSLIDDGGKEGKKKPNWLKVDFDKWTPSPNDNDSEPDNDFEKINGDNGYAEHQMDELTRKILADYKTKPMTFKEATEYMRNVQANYLFVYNASIFLAHFYVLSVLLFGIATQGTDYFDGFWARISLPAKVCTALQYMDVLHSIAGLTKGGYQAGLMQVTGRLLMLHIIDGDPHVHQWVFTFALMVVYFLVEMFRYPYYALSSKNIDVHVVTWLRYSAWMVLYPSGFILEAIIIATAIPFYYTSGVYSIQLPNVANIGFNFGVFLTVLLAGMPFITQFLFKHMLHQRRKKMADVKKKKC